MAKRPGIPFPFVDGTTIFFRWADAKAAAERVTGERSAAPGALIQALGQCDLNAVEIGLQHGLKNIGDLSPVTRDFGSETWQVDQVAGLLIEAIQNLFLGTKAVSEDAAIADTHAFLEAGVIRDKPYAAESAMREATRRAEEVEAAHAPASQEAAHVET